MDIAKLIRKQITDINSDGHSPYLDMILNHLDRAETYYQSGQQDSHFYNDVVYRTNQAFEGALKESFKVLVGKTDEQIARTTPHKIEKYLKDHEIFNERVLRLFEAYRQDWRNRSTHDYKMVLDENEAFLALVNVSSFVHLLLKQIQEKNAFNREMQKQVANKELKEARSIVTSPSHTLTDKILKLMAKFVAELPEGNVFTNEMEINGQLNAFLVKRASELSILREPMYTAGRIRIMPDFIIEQAQEKVLLEVKRESRPERLNAQIQQVVSYLTVAGIQQGILFFGKGTIQNGDLLVDTHQIRVEGKDLTIHLIH